MPKYLRILVIAALSDAILFSVLSLVGVEPLTSEFASFFLGAALGYGARAGLLKNAEHNLFHLALVLLTLALRSAIFSSALAFLPLVPSYILALLATVCLLLWQRESRAIASPIKLSTLVNTPILLIGVIFALFAARFIYAGLADLIPEEAYYWLYARHLDIGYLDHPPVVAWLIALGETLFGHHSFSVRFGALICSCVSAYFIFKLTQDFFDRKTAWCALLLASVLPYFFGASFVMTPDAPLVASWSATLYFLQRALVKGDARAWKYAGVGLGLGMISKYTIVLVAVSAVLLTLMHRPSRRWFFRREPYLAVLIALLLFSPVIIWNARHAWASFLFQSSSRFENSSRFALPQYLLNMIYLVLPTGVLGVLYALKHFTTRDKAIESSVEERLSPELFMIVCWAVPVLLFGAVSFRHLPKLNWAGPAFLALLPQLAHQIVFPNAICAARGRLILQRAWLPMLSVMIIAYAIIFHYFVIGLPGFGYGRAIRRFVGWQDLGQKISAIRHNEEVLSGRTLGLIGMDRHNISSELAYYTSDSLKEDPTRLIAGRKLFGWDSLMFNFWAPPQAAIGKDFLLVSWSRKELEEPRLNAYFEVLQPIKELYTEKRADRIVPYYYRVALHYRSAEGAP